MPTRNSPQHATTPMPMKIAVEALLGRPVVGDGAEQRGDERDDQERDRVDGREPLGGAALGDAGARHLHEVDRKHGHHDRRLDRRGRPVVHRPGAKLRAAQAQPVEQRWSWHCGEDRVGRMTRQPFRRAASPRRTGAPPGLLTRTRVRPCSLRSHWRWSAPSRFRARAPIPRPPQRRHPPIPRPSASGAKTSPISRASCRDGTRTSSTRSAGEQFDSALARARPQAAGSRAPPGDRRAGADRRAGGRRAHQHRPHPGPEDRVPHLSGAALLLQGRALHPQRREAAVPIWWARR